MTMQLVKILNEVRAIKAALSEQTDDMMVQCIGCSAVVEALLLVRQLERKLEREVAIPSALGTRELHVLRC